MSDLTLQEHFLAKVNKTETCWNWTGYLSGGYGQFHFEKKDHWAHRFSYQLFVGPVPTKASGLVIDHICSNRQCVRPDHLQVLTIGENVLRGNSLSAMHRSKTHCSNGHEFTPENTYMRVDKYGRMCRTCTRLRMRERSRAMRSVA